MADPATYRPAPGTIPTEPGVYKFRDEAGRVIYVGKAINLRARLSSYFQDLSNLHPRTRTMVQTAASVEWTVVSTEVEALQLEYTWIKQFDPRFNVRFKDDKSYPMLAVSVKDSVPRAFMYRGERRKGIRYFGPYSQAWAIKQTLDLLIKVFPVRTCTQGVFNRQANLGRPCLLGYIDKCSAPCVGRVTVEEHREIVNGFLSFMNGNSRDISRQITRNMEEASAQLDFEKAAQYRDQLLAISEVMEQQAVVLLDGVDADFVAVEAEEFEVAIQIFHVRDGRIQGQRGWVVERPDHDDVTRMLAEFLVQFYSDTAAYADELARVETHNSGTEHVKRGIPRTIYVDALPLNQASVEDYLSDLAHARVQLKVPHRGDKRSLLDTVLRNAKEQLQRHKLHRGNDLTTRSAALQELQEALRLDTAPLRIECIDVSHIQGTDVVASLVVFEDGAPRKSDYRRFHIKEAAGGGKSDDVASIAEVVSRRFRYHHADSRVVPDEEVEQQHFAEERGAVPAKSAHSAKFAYPPQLFVVDGGAPQVAAAAKVFDDLGIRDVALIGIAKRLEEIWLPDDDEPVILARNSQALFLLQRLRDEAHRFAITYHRQKRSQRMTASVLDGIPGLGPTKRAALVKHFGSVAALRQASVQDITEVPGFGPVLADAIVEHLKEG